MDDVDEWFFELPFLELIWEAVAANVICLIQVSIEYALCFG